MIPDCWIADRIQSSYSINCQSANSLHRNSNDAVVKASKLQILLRCYDKMMEFRGVATCFSHAFNLFEINRERFCQIFRCLQFTFNFANATLRLSLFVFGLFVWNRNSMQLFNSTWHLNYCLKRFDVLLLNECVKVNVSRFNDTIQKTTLNWTF